MQLLNKIRVLNVLLSVIIWGNIHSASRAHSMKLRVEDDAVQMHFTVAEPAPEVVSQQHNVGIQSSCVHESLASRATRFYTMQAAHKKYQQEQKEIEYYSQFTHEQLHREIIDYIQNACRAGHSMSRAQELVLGNNHLYCLPAFVDNVKEFPTYRAHVKDMHAKYQNQKGRFYDFRKRHGWIAHDFVKAVEIFEQLNAVIVSEEICESEMAQVQVRQLFSDYKVARPSKSSASVARMRDREQALYKTQVTNYARTAQRYRLSDTALRIVSEHRYDPALFTDFVGTELQHQLQRESVDLVSQAIEMSVRRTGNQSPVPLDMIMHFTVASCELNRNGDVAQGYMVSDFCWALLDYGTAILEGSGQGLKAAVQDMKAHPIQTVASVVAAQGVVAYQLAKLLTEVAQVSIQGTINNLVMAFNPEEGAKRWAAQLEPIHKTIDALCTKEMSVRSGIKEGTKLAVQLTIQSKLLGGLKEFYAGVRTRAASFVRKNPAAMPEQYMATPEGLLFKVARDASGNEKLLDKPQSSVLQWISYDYKHVASKNMKWQDVIKATKSGPAKYKHEINIEQLERTAWSEGIVVKNKTWKVFKCTDIIGANNGIETHYLVVKNSANTLHGHPITLQEFNYYVKG